MYQVIARKYRPQSFEDVVNQEHVKQTLINALTQGRVGHGYIFSGPRGTGKTTMARILAKALNCEKGPNATPCQECSSCREVTAGNSMDLVEIDAASNRRIDDIRELRENVRYRPVRDRHKVFIIDEAHQITADAFNALLKTLEEPPEWVVFILCTTEPQQFPATIVSRCQSFPFRTVEMDDVVGRMQYICKQEGIEADDDALVAIALSGDGSIRDSLSTLDQAIASFGKKLEAGPVRDLLGAIPSEIAEKILEALRGQDASAMLGVVDRLAREGRHLQHFCGELTRYFRNLMVMKVSGADTRLVTTGPSERKRLAAWTEQFSQEDLTRYVNLLVDLYRDMQNAPQPRFRLEIGLLKLVHAGRLQPLEKLLAGWNPGSGSGRGPDPSDEPKRGRETSASSAETVTGTRAGNGAAHGLDSAHGLRSVDAGAGLDAPLDATPRANPSLPPDQTPPSVARLAAVAGASAGSGRPVVVAGAPVAERTERAVANPVAAPAVEPTGVATPAPESSLVAQSAVESPTVEPPTVEPQQAALEKAATTAIPTAVAAPTAAAGGVSDEAEVASDPPKVKEPPSAGPLSAAPKSAPTESTPKESAAPVSAKPAASQGPASEAAPTGDDSAAADMRQRLAEALSAMGDDHLADGIEHCQISVKGNIVEVRPLADYRVVLDMELGAVQEAARKALGANLRVTLGSDLASTEHAPSSASNAAGNAAGGGESTAGPAEAVQRALADPEVQRIQKLFTGQIREVRNLRGYTT